MRVSYNILLTVILHLAILFTPLAAKLLHHHTFKAHHQEEQMLAYCESESHCYVCEFEYLPWFSDELKEINRTTHPKIEKVSFYNGKIFGNSHGNISLRAPPVL